MPAVRIRLGLKDLAAELAKPIDYGPLMKLFGQMMRDNAVECFERACSPDGTPWKPLKHPRPNSKGGDIPLNDTGRLRSSVTSEGADGNVSVYEPRRVECGTNLDHAPIHNFGDGSGGDYILTPKQAKFLAIPATVQAQRKGSPRNWAAGELVFRFGSTGGVALAGKVIQYYFAKSVAIPARPYLGISDDQAKEFEEETADYVADRITDAMRGAGAV